MNTARTRQRRSAIAILLLASAAAVLIGCKKDPGPSSAPTKALYGLELGKSQHADVEKWTAWRFADLEVRVTLMRASGPFLGVYEQWVEPHTDGVAAKN